MRDAQRDATAADRPSADSPGLPRTCGRRRWLRKLAPLAVVLAIGAIIVASGLHRYLWFGSFIDKRAALADFVSEHYAVALLGMGAIYAVAVALSLPVGLALSLASGFLFGPVVGGILIVVAATTGATALFILAHGALGEVLAAKAGPKIQMFARGFREDAFNYLLFLRLVPVAPFWIVNLAPALLGVPLRTYVLATAIGILPASFAFATLGSGLDSVIAAQQAACAGSDCSVSLNVHDLVTPRLIAGFVALGVVALVPVAVKKWKCRRRAAR